MVRRGVALALTALACSLTGGAWAPAGAVSVPARTRSVPAPVRCAGCWKPGLRVSWQWQLSEVPKRWDLLDVRMYDTDGFETPVSLVQALHRQGSKAVCYVSAGSREIWRPDAKRFPTSVLGRPLDGWPGERWLDVRRLDVLGPIMRARLDMCARKGFDGVEFDNVDGYANRTGLPLTRGDQLRYDVFLANQAHRRGLFALLKNDLGQVRSLLRYFDGALNEECRTYRECYRLQPFVDAGKPVFGVEYALDTSEFCPSANHRNFNFLKKRLALGAWRVPCRGV